MKKELLEKDFSFKVSMEKKEAPLTIEVHLTSHLFTKRTVEGITDTRIRAHIFKTRDQYENLFTAAIEKYELLSYTNKGRVAFLFNAQEERYGILLDVVTSEAGYLITVITLDKIGERHYISNALFGKEKNKIYTEYVLPVSYMRAASKRMHTAKSYNIYHTHHFDKIYVEQELNNNIDFTRLYNSVITRHLQGSIDYGQHWFKFKINAKEEVCIRVSLERDRTKYGIRSAVILVDFKSSFEKTQQLALSTGEEIFDIGTTLPNGFGRQRVEIISKPGLRIKKKDVGC